jgi:hypothetical protein
LGSSLIIGELPAGNPFHIATATTIASSVPNRVHPLIRASAAVAKNVMTIDNSNFYLPLVQFGVGKYLFLHAFALPVSHAEEFIVMITG